MIESTIVDKYKLNDLTPIEFHNGILFKRDDLYQPFKDIPLSGGKVRQAISLIANNEKYIKEDCCGNIFQSQLMSSPQGVIMSRVVKDFGFNFTLFYGNTNPKVFSKNNLVLSAMVNGARVNYESKLAYNSVIESTIKKYKDRGLKFFRSDYSLNTEFDEESIFYSNGNQVQNIPKDLDYLIIPCGLCISAVGVIKGLLKYNILPKKVLLIQISGYDRKSKVIDYLGKDADSFDWKFYVSKDFPYSKEYKFTYGSIRLDSHYESKAFYFMEKYLKEKLNNKKILFWIVGDSTDIRNYKVDIHKIRERNGM